MGNRNKTRTTEEFIKLAGQVHGNKYSYEKTHYIKSSAKVIITCPIHGDFEQVANSHLLGHGCAKCGMEQGTRKVALQKGLPSFLDKAKKKFPQYDYSKVEWKNNHYPVEIICPKHGSFFIGPSALLHKNCKVHACPKCKKQWHCEERGKQIIKEAMKVHNGYYSYEKVPKCFKKTDLVTIICPMHGEFQQTMKNHVKGSICTYCMNEKRSYAHRYHRKDRPAYVYLAYFPNHNLYKIGVTVDLQKRFGGELEKPEILFSKRYETEEQAYYIETCLFRKYSSFKYKGNPVLKRKGNKELLVQDISHDIASSVEAIETTKEFNSLGRE